ncbi:unnamed protein product [Prunus armeniaca]|uniref:Protein FAR1-RELATED SEQUENCE n=1 Tax=Prunus armeniaca TaxID=36596 RepID=A0A6J5XRB8_PRUAR|nr:unnamed protein product [Prunus armeniaca]
MGVEIDLNLPEEDGDGVSQDNTNIFKSAGFINEDTYFSEMEFHSDDKAYEFYSKTSGEWIGAKFACTRHGKKRKSNAINPRPCLKIDCKASLEVKRREHNHDLHPEHIHYFPSNRRITNADKYNINALHSDEYETLEGHNGMKVNMDWMGNYNLWTSRMHEYFAGQATQDGTVDTY